MGCACSRGSDSELDHNYIKPFEKTLKIHKAPVSKMIKSLRIFRHKSALPGDKVEKILQENSIPILHHYRFFRYFQEETEFNLLKLLSLLILLSNELFEKKLELLFDIYRQDSLVLDQQELSLMMENLLQISCYYIPTYVSSMHLNNEILSKYSQHLRIVLDRTVVDIVNDFLNDNQEVNKSYFSARIVHKFGFLVKAKRIRSYCYRIYTSIIKPVEELLNADEKIHSSKHELDKSNDAHHKNDSSEIHASKHIINNHELKKKIKVKIQNNSKNEIKVNSKKDKDHKSNHSDFT